MSAAGEIDEAKIAEFKQSFSVFATLNNGSAIDAEKLGGLMHALGLNLRQDEIRDLVHEVDEDGSGEIEFEEFLTMMLKMSKDEAGQSESVECFRMLDPDGVGLIHKEKIDAIIDGLGVSIAEDEKRDLFAQMDDDGNGMISFDEFHRHVMGKKDV